MDNHSMSSKILGKIPSDSSNKQQHGMLPLNHQWPSADETDVDFTPQGSYSEFSPRLSSNSNIMSSSEQTWATLSPYLSPPTEQSHMLQMALEKKKNIEQEIEQLSRMNIQGNIGGQNQLSTASQYDPLSLPREQKHVSLNLGLTRNIPPTVGQFQKHNIDRVKNSKNILQSFASSPKVSFSGFSPQPVAPGQQQIPPPRNDLPRPFFQQQQQGQQQQVLPYFISPRETSPRHYQQQQQQQLANPSPYQGGAGFHKQQQQPYHHQQEYQQQPPSPMMSPYQQQGQVGGSPRNPPPPPSPGGSEHYRSSPHQQQFFSHSPRLHATIIYPQQQQLLPQHNLHVQIPSYNVSTGGRRFIGGGMGSGGRDGFGHLSPHGGNSLYPTPPVNVATNNNNNNNMRSPHMGAEQYLANEATARGSNNSPHGYNQNGAGYNGTSRGYGGDGDGHGSGTGSPGGMMTRDNVNSNPNNYQQQQQQQEQQKQGPLQVHNSLKAPLSLISPTVAYRSSPVINARGSPSMNYNNNNNLNNNNQKNNNNSINSSGCNSLNHSLNGSLRSPINGEGSDANSPVLFGSQINTSSKSNSSSNSGNQQGNGTAGGAKSNTPTGNGNGNGGSARSSPVVGSGSVHGSGVHASNISGQQLVYQVQFKRNVRDFIPGPRAPQTIPMGELVVVQCQRGEDLGVIIDVMPLTTFVERRYIAKLTTEPSEQEESSNVTHILRVATMHEKQQLPEKHSDELGVIETAAKMVKDKFELSMAIEDAEYQFDRQKLTIFYTSNSRIDFREFVKEMFATYNVRVWMKKVSPSFIPKQFALDALRTGKPYNGSP